MLSGHLDPVQGCRILVQYGEELEKIAGSDYGVIAGIESETDDLPLGEVRTQWAKSALEEKDQKKKRYLLRVEPELRAACERILQKMSTQ